VFAGIWSSVFSLSLTQLWNIVTGVIPSWASNIGEEVNNTGKRNAISILYLICNGIPSRSVKLN